MSNDLLVRGMKPNGTTDDFDGTVLKDRNRGEIRSFGSRHFHIFTRSRISVHLKAQLPVFVVVVGIKNEIYLVGSFEIRVFWKIGLIWDLL